VRPYRHEARLIGELPFIRGGYAHNGALFNRGSRAECNR
jgi:hypothetical protein